MPEGEWFTYSQLGERWGISAAAVRQKAIRARWPRRPANDGKTLVRPAMEDVRVPSPRKPKDAPSTNARPTPVERPSDTRTIAALERHIETLKTAAATTEARLEQERTRADRLQEELLELAKSRADLTSRLVQAEKEAAAAPALRGSVEALKAALEAERQLRDELRRELDRRSRPWWRRLTRAA
jgi:predicted RNase H-like nuclease (RuvC/YqgF family)